MPQRLETLEELRDHLSAHVHVLVILLSESWGGLEQTALADTRRLVKNGLKVSFLVKEDSPIDHVLKQESPHIRRIYSPRKVRNWIDFRFMRQIRDLVDIENVNLIHVHQTGLLGSVVPALLGRAHVALAVSRHILNNHNKRDPLHALIYRRVDFLLVLSQTMRNNVVATFPVREKRVRTVNLGINLQRFNPHLVDRNTMRDEWGVAKDAFLVGVVGRLDPAKGQDVLVKALPRVAHDIPEVMGVLVGDETPGLEGAYREQIEESIRQLHLEGRMLICHATDDVPLVLAALDLFVMPSWSEAFGLVALEAMAMGVPCILAGSGSVAEIARGSGSRMFRPGDAFDLGRQIMQLYRSPDERARMAKKAREYVHAHHSEDLRFYQTLDIYHRCERRRM